MRGKWSADGSRLQNCDEWDCRSARGFIKCSVSTSLHDSIPGGRHEAKYSAELPARLRNGRRDLRKGGKTLPGHVDLRPEFEREGLMCHAQGRTRYVLAVRGDVPGGFRVWAQGMSARIRLSRRNLRFGPQKRRRERHVIRLCSTKRYADSTCWASVGTIHAVSAESNPVKSRRREPGHRANPQPALARALGPAMEREPAADGRRINGDQTGHRQSSSGRVRDALAQDNERERNPRRAAVEPGLRRAQHCAGWL